ncbi:MAG: SMI1/KNR4 family protein, partial [Ktedonobacteraceae bacterium]|nr:SMI1/KNR4 family protein [Ktedonobacteraceae bacterium]
FQLLADWDQRGDVLLPEQHVVLAEDAGGCPVVWDAATDQVRVFQYDGGDWEPPLASSVDAFLTDLFNPEEEKKEKDWWYLFLGWLDGHLKERSSSPE